MAPQMITTRPGDHSAKTARQVGAPNNHDNAGSGETSMVVRTADRPIRTAGMAEGLHELADFVVIHELPDAYLSVSDGYATVIVDSTGELEVWAQALGASVARVNPTSAYVHITVVGHVGAVNVDAVLSVDASTLSGSVALPKRGRYPLSELAFIGADAR